VSVRTKLYTAIAVTVAGLALMAGVGIWAMSSLADRFDVVQQAADDRALALQLKFDIADFNGWQTAYGYDSGASRPVFLASVAAFRRDFARARRELDGAVEQRLLGEMSDAFRDFMRVDAQAYAALRAGRTGEVRRLFLGPEIHNFQRAALAAQQLAAREDARAGAEERRFRDARRDALRYLILAALLTGVSVAILLATAVDLRAELARDSVRPLEQER
jgi:methyl-accepting chemotaxis protein